MAIEWFFGNKKQEKINKLEIDKALQDGNELAKEYDLKTTPYSLMKFSAEESYEKEDSVAIINVPYDIFPQLVNDKKVSYVYTAGYPNDDSAGYGPQMVWFNTNSKLRVFTEFPSPLGTKFMEDILRPSYQAQTAQLAEIIGNRNISFEEWDRLSKEKGFSIHDYHLGVIGGQKVARVKLLPPEEAEKFKGKLFIFNIQKK